MTDIIKRPDVQKLAKAQKFQDAIDAIINTGDKPFVAMQYFTALLNTKPKPKDIDVRDGIKYVPIGIVETRLDQFYFGNWRTEKFQWTREFNEIVGSLELVCINPITNEETRRIGAAAVQVLQKKNTDLKDFNEFKIKNALVAGFPKLKAECLKNAAKGLGEIFGRNLSRDKFDDPVGIIPEEEVNINAQPENKE